MTELLETWNRDAVVVSGLDVQAGGNVLLRNISFVLGAQSHVALLGRNGSGKSTLLRWFASEGVEGVEGAEGARLWTVYLVEQEMAESTRSALDIVLSAHLVRGRLWSRLRELEAIDDLTETQLEEYQTASQALDSMGAERDEARVRKILRGLGLSTEQISAPLKSLSGGYRARVALAQGLFMEPALLLLDEPTNHLDLEGVIWLSDFLSKWPKALVVVSHNASFIREVSDAQWCIERKSLYTYRGSYDKFLSLRRQEHQKARDTWDKYEKELKALRSKGRSTEALEARHAGTVRPERAYQPRFLFSDREAAGSGAALVSLTDVCLGYETRVLLRGVSIGLYRGTRVALIGPNGSGKSTLLDCIQGTSTAQTGGTAQKAPGLRVCRFEQHFYHLLPEDESPVQYISGTGCSVVEVRKLLGTSGLEGSLHTRPIGDLSGGQRSRVYLAYIISKEPDVLLLDEPTNHLDMETIDGLAEALSTFPGAAVVVSHDMDFLERVCTDVWRIKEEIVQSSNGTDELDAYVEDVLSGDE